MDASLSRIRNGVEALLILTLLGMVLLTFADVIGRRVFGTPVYQRAYAPMALDATAEQQRWQRAGAITSTAPAPAAE